jgi:hypothetical protein
LLELRVPVLAHLDVLVHQPLEQRHRGAHVAFRAASTGSHSGVSNAASAPKSFTIPSATRLYGSFTAPRPKTGTSAA